MTCGWGTDLLRRHHTGNLVDVYRIVFYAYAMVGLVKASLVFLLSSAVEAEANTEAPANPSSGNGRETEPLLQNNREGQDSTRKTKKWLWLPQFSRESARVVFTLCILFGLDSFASGLVPL